jgi:hypothetical protein
MLPNDLSEVGADSFVWKWIEYLYLLFSDSDVIPLDQYVFNTEAHILPVFTPTVKRAFSFLSPQSRRQVPCSRFPPLGFSLWTG